MTIETRSAPCEQYKLLGFGSKKRDAIIMIRSSGKTFTIGLAELLKSSVIDQLSRDELKHVYRRFYSRDTTPTAYDLGDRHEKSWLIYTGLNLLLLMLYVVTGIAATKLVHIESLDIIVTPGLFLYPLTFLVVDVLNESYGLKLTRKAILFAFAGNAIIVLLLALSTLLPGLPEWKLDSPYTDVVKHLSSVLLASSVSFLLSEYVNSYLLCKIKELTHSRYLYLRVFLSTLFATVVDSILFCFIAFYGTLPTPIIIEMITVQIIIKALLAVINIAPAYGARAVLRTYLTR